MCVYICIYVVRVQEEGDSVKVACTNAVCCRHGTFAEENFRELVENKIFTEKTFTDCSLVPPKDATPLNFAEKTFAISHKTSKFVKVFSLESFQLYSIEGH